jgi:hypothetical protein
MKLTFVADVHIANHRWMGGAVQAGLNDRCREHLAVLRRAVERSKELGCRALFVLGDLFDSSRPEPQVIAAAQEALRGVEAYVIAGNHDVVSSAAGDHALGPLDGHDLVKVVERPELLEFDGLSVLCVPYQPGDAREYVSKAWKKHVGTGFTLLLTHAGILDDGTPPWLRNAANALPHDWNLEVDAWLSGDWHRHKRWGKNVAQVGTLVPHSFSDEGLDGYGKLAVFDTEKGLSFEEVPGPRFVKLAAGDDLPRAPRGCRLYVRATADADRLADVRAHGLQMVEQGAIAGFEAGLDEKEVQATTRSAVGAARATESMGEALEAYVREMQLDLGIDRAAVLERCRGFLR